MVAQATTQSSPGIGADLVSGGDGDDLIFGGDGNDTVFAEADNDHVFGNAGEDSIEGGAGNDTLNGGAGADTLDGGAGLDSASYESALIGLSVDLSNPDGNTSEALNDTYVSIENLIGSGFDDALRATGFANVVFGGAGDDFILARSGDDTLFGGLGDDRLEGGNGNDTLDGGEGADELNGGSGYDTATYADASAGVTADIADPLQNTGHASGDTYVSIEYLAGSDFDDLLGASSLGTYLFGGLGDDTLNGNDGEDTLEGGAAADVLNGGSGIDTATYANATAGVSVDFSNANRNSGEAFGDTHTSIENLVGSDHADDLRGSGGVNEIYAGDGEDFILARSGDDAVFGESGDDRLEGGNGDDTLEGGSGADVLNGGNGYDSAAYATALSAVSVDLNNSNRNTGDALGDTHVSIENLIGSNYSDSLRASGEDNVVWSGSGNDFVLARSGNDAVYGEAGNDRIEGGNGDDTLVGGDGADTLNGGAGADVFVFGDGDSGVDEVVDFVAGIDLLDVAAWGVASSSDLSFDATSNGAYFDVEIGYGNNAFEVSSISNSTLSDADFIFL